MSPITSFSLSLSRSCISNDDLCPSSYGICAHAAFSSAKATASRCSKSTSAVNISECQCDSGYVLKKVNDASVTCLAQSERTFDVMLNPRGSFYLNQHDSIFSVRSRRNTFSLVFIGLALAHQSVAPHHRRRIRTAGQCLVFDLHRTTLRTFVRLATEAQSTDQFNQSTAEQRHAGTKL